LENDDKVKVANSDFSDELIASLAKHHKVSFSVILRRLSTLGYITPTEYNRRYKKFQDEVVPELLANARKQKEDFIPGPYFHPSRWVTTNSPKYSNEVFSRFYDKQIGYGELTRYLGVALEHVPKIQRYLGHE
jgi:hypothetical protein